MRVSSGAREGQPEPQIGCQGSQAEPVTRRLRLDERELSDLNFGSLRVDVTAADPSPPVPRLHRGHQEDKPVTTYRKYVDVSQTELQARWTTERALAPLLTDVLAALRRLV